MNELKNYNILCLNHDCKESNYYTLNKEKIEKFLKEEAHRRIKVINNSIKINQININLNSDKLERSNGLCCSYYMENYLNIFRFDILIEDINDIDKEKLQEDKFFTIASIIDKNNRKIYFFEDIEKYLKDIEVEYGNKIKFSLLTNIYYHFEGEGDKDSKNLEIIKDDISLLIYIEYGINVDPKIIKKKIAQIEKKLNLPIMYSSSPVLYLSEMPKFFDENEINIILDKRNKANKDGSGKINGIKNAIRIRDFSENDPVEKKIMLKLDKLINKFNIDTINPVEKFWVNNI